MKTLKSNGSGENRGVWVDKKEKKKEKQGENEQKKKRFLLLSKDLQNRAISFRRIES